MFKEGNDWVRSVVSNCHARIGGVNPKDQRGHLAEWAKLERLGQNETSSGQDGGDGAIGWRSGWKQEFLGKRTSKS